MSITAEKVRELLQYDPETGVFAWRATGKVAGSHSANGYYSIQISGVRRRVHWWAWLYVYGEMPGDGCEIDHVNCNQADNRIANLRLCTQNQNAANRRRSRNNTSGFKGVSRAPSAANPWKAQIRHDGKLLYLGLFPTAEAAHEAYKAAAADKHGAFARAA